MLNINKRASIFTNYWENDFVFRKLVREAPHYLYQFSSETYSVKNYSNLILFTYEWLALKVGLFSLKDKKYSFGFKDNIFFNELGKKLSLDGALNKNDEEIGNFLSESEFLQYIGGRTGLLKVNKPLSQREHLARLAGYESFLSILND